MAVEIQARVERRGGIGDHHRLDFSKGGKQFSAFMVASRFPEAVAGYEGIVTLERRVMGDEAGCATVLYITDIRRSPEEGSLVGALLRRWARRKLAEGNA